MNIISKIFGANAGKNTAIKSSTIVELPKSETSASPALEPTDMAGPLPKTLKELWPVLTRLGQMKGSHRTRAEWNKWRMRHKEVQTLCHNLQQGMPVLHDTAQAAIAQAQQRVNFGLARRKARIESLQSFLKVPFPEFERPPAYDLSGSPRDALLAEPVVQEGIWMCRRLLAELEIHELQNFDLAFPQARHAELVSEIQRETDLDRVRSLRSELAGIQILTGSLTGDLNARNSFSQKLVPVMDEVRNHLKICEDLLLLWQLDAMAAEENWFNSFGLPRERTQLSARFEEAAKQLPTLSREALAWFGVNDIAAV